jgi:hypothetical protein
MVVVTLWAIAKSKNKVWSARVTETEKAPGPRSIAGVGCWRSLARYAPCVTCTSIGLVVRG